MILFFYLLNRFLLGLMISLVVLVSIEVFFSFTAELKYLDVGNYDFITIVKYIILSIPRSIEIMFPYAILIGALLSLGAMAADMEFVAMQASGISVKKILTIVLLQVFIVSSVFYIITDSIVPKYSSKAEKKRNIALNKQTMYQRNGFWFKNKSSFIKIQEIYPQEIIKGITVYEYDSNNKINSVSYISSAKHYNNQWELFDVLKINLSSIPISKSSYDKIYTKDLIDIDLLSIKTNKSYSLSLSDVSRNIDYLETNKLDTSIQEKIFWEKVLKPFSTTIMLFLAMPFIFGKMRNTNASKRIVIGLFIGISFFILSSILPNMGIIIGLNPLVNALLPLLIFSGLGVYLYNYQLESGIR